MKRRKFMWMSTATVVSVFVPVIGCNSRSNFVDFLAAPDMLSRFSDSSSIIEIGKLYQGLNELEANKEKLVDLLVEDANLSSSDNRIQLQESLKIKIRNEFKSKRTIILEGWVLSETEARQCALFSIINN